MESPARIFGAEFALFAIVHEGQIRQTRHRARNPLAPLRGDNRSNVYLEGTGHVSPPVINIKITVASDSSFSIVGFYRSPSVSHYRRNCLSYWKTAMPSDTFHWTLLAYPSYEAPHDMDYYYDIAFAVANKSACFFTGAGFSKQISGNKMPGWKELLELLCTYLSQPLAAKTQLDECFAAGLPLEDCAQVLELMFLKESKDIRDAIADRIKSFSIDVSGAKVITAFLQVHPTLKIISTNYDDLIQRFILPDKCNTNYPGKPVTHRDSQLDIYQVHGSVDHPPSIIATTEDYYRFINSPTYFSRKIFTLMSENTTIFLGYALGDPNLKAVIHAFRSTSSGTLSRGSLFYVTRSKIPQYLKDHYEMSFGLFVIDQKDIDSFLGGVGIALPEAEKQVQTAEINLKNVLAGTHHYNDRYLRSSQALSHIILVASKTGQNIESEPFTKLLSGALERKVAFSKENGAWEQYAHLAQWLVYVGSLMNIRGSALETSYLKAVTHSMSTMSESMRLGYSWAAFSTWSNNWGNIMFKNRQLIAQHIQSTLPTNPDAMKILSI